MNEREYTLEKISYSKKEDCRILESVLNQWFKNPKTLNLVSPKLAYPFKFKNWVLNNYKSAQTISSIVIKRKNWIIGHISYRFEKNKTHLFHLIIDEKFRRLGLAQTLVRKVEKDCFLKQKDYLILNILNKNDIAVNLFEKLGYSIFSKKNSKIVLMKKN